MSITAVSADGVSHEFPDGTNPAVIDKVMKDYAVSKQPPAAPQRSLGEELGRQAGLTARYAAEGAAYIPAAIADVPAYLYNKGADLIQGEGKGYRFPEQNQNISDALTKAGLPQPETGVEKVVGDASRAIAGAGAFTAAGKVLSQAAEPVVAQVGKSLASSPGYQAVGSAVSGAGAGGAHELNTGPVGEVIGGATGLLVPGGTSVKSAAQILSRLRGSPVSEEEAAHIASNYLVKTLGRDELSPGQVSQRLDAAGNKPVTIADVGGENTVAALRTATQSPGPARNATKEFLTERQAGQRERIGQDTNATFGSADAEKLNYATKANRSANAEADFRDAFGKGVIRSKPLSSLFQAPAMKDAIGYAQQIAGNEYAVARADNRLGAADTEDWAKAVADLPNKTAFPARYLHFIKMGLDAKLESLRDPLTQRINYSDPSVRAADNVRKRFRSEVKNLNPAYADALDHFSSDSALLTAQRDGASALNLAPEQIATMRNRMSPQEQVRFRVGFGKALQDMIERSSDNTNAAGRIIGNTLMRKRIANVIGDAKATGDYLRNIAGEQRMFETKAAMGGSMTTPRALDEADLAGESLSNFLSDSVRSGSPRHTLINRAADWIDRKYDLVAKGLTEQVKTKLANMLISTDKAEQQAAIASLERMKSQRASNPRTLPFGSANAIAEQIGGQQQH